MGSRVPGLQLWIIILSGPVICVSHGEVPQFDQIGAIKNLIVTKLQLVEGRKQEIKFNYYFRSSSLRSEYTYFLLHLYLLGVENIKIENTHPSSHSEEEKQLQRSGINY